MGVYYPPVGFYFAFSIPGVTNSLDMAFQEISGISAEMNVEEIGSGGENRFKYKVPNGTKYSNLVAKRGFVTPASQLAQWCVQTIGSDLTNAIVPKDITVTLLNPDAKALKAWNFVNAWPVKWSVSDFKSKEGEIVIESIEFAYNYFNST